MVENLRHARASRYVAKVPDFYEPRRHIAVTDSLCLDARSEGMKQQWVGSFAVFLACAVGASVSAASAQRLAVESEASFTEDFGPLRSGLGQAVALSADGTRALIGVPGFALSTSPSDPPWSAPGMAIVFFRTGD